MNGLRRHLMLALVAATASCGTEARDGSAAAPSPDAMLSDTGSDASARSQRTVQCPAGQAPGPGSVCMPIGPQGCDERFITPSDGLCRPSMEACGPGEIPDFREGCVPVGIDGCHADFVSEDDGLCHPSLAACPPGSLPHVHDGCVTVGPRDCHPMWVDGEDGLCKPSRLACEAGEIPVLSQGCTNVGVPGCAAEFMDDETGLCWPRLAHCPAGWIPAFGPGCVPVGIPNCAPPFVQPDGSCLPSSDACAGGELPVPSAGCASVPLGPDAWPDAPSSGLLLHVAAGSGAPEPDGSEAAPYPSLSAAIEVAAPGTTVLVMSGTYDLPVALSQDVTIAGDGAVVLMTSSETVVSDALVALSGVTVLPTDGPALSVTAGGSLALSSCRVEATGVGLEVSGGSLVVTGSLLIAGASAAVAAEGDGEISLSGVVIEAGSAADAGPAIDLSDGSSLQASEVVVRHAGDPAILAVGAGTAVMLGSSVLVPAGSGVEARSGAIVEVQDSMILGATGHGLRARDDGTLLTASNSLVADTGGAEDAPKERPGRGAEAADGATVDLTGVTLARNLDAGVFAAGGGATLSCTECLIDGTDARAVDLHHGFGAAVDVDGGVVLTASAVIDSHSSGLYASGAGASIVLDQTLVAETRYERLSGTAGAGATAVLDGHITATGSAFMGNHSAGLLAAVGGGIDATWTWVDGTRRATTPGSQGAGVRAQWAAPPGGTIRITETLVTDSDGPGVLCEQGEVVVEGCVVEGNTARGGEIIATVQVQATCDGEVTDTIVRDNGDNGFRAATSGSVSVQDSLFMTNTSQSDAPATVEVLAEPGGTVTLDGNVLYQNVASAAVAVSGEPVTISRTLVMEQQPRPAGAFANGIVLYGATTVEDSYVFDVAGTGIGVWQGSAEVSRTVVEGVRPAGLQGRGVTTGADTTVVLSRSAIRDPASSAIKLGGGTSLTIDRSLLATDESVLTDNAVHAPDAMGALLIQGSVVRGAWQALVVAVEAQTVLVSRSLLDGAGTARGLAAAAGTVEVSDSAVLDLVGIGIGAVGVDAALTVDRVVLSGFHSPAEGTALYEEMLANPVLETAAAVRLGEGAQGVVRDTWVDGPTDVGMFTYATARLLVENTLIDGVTPNGVNDERGVGMVSFFGGEIEATGVGVYGASAAGALFYKASGALHGCILRDVARGQITDLANTTFDQLGDGLIAGDEAEVTVAGSVLSDNHRAGFVFSNSSGSVEGCVVERNAYGFSLDGALAPTMGANTFEANPNGDCVDGACVLEVPASLSEVVGP